MVAGSVFKPGHWASLCCPD